MNQTELTVDPWPGVQGRGRYSSRGSSICEGLSEGDSEVGSIMSSAVCEFRGL